MCGHVKLLPSCPTLSDPMDPRVAHQVALSIGFSRQESWSRLPCLPPGDLTDAGIESVSLASLASQICSLPAPRYERNAVTMVSLLGALRGHTSLKVLIVKPWA